MFLEEAPAPLLFSMLSGRPFSTQSTQLASAAGRDGLCLPEKENGGKATRRTASPGPPAVKAEAAGARGDAGRASQDGAGRTGSGSTTCARRAESRPPPRPRLPRAGWERPRQLGDCELRVAPLLVAMLDGDSHLLVARAGLPKREDSKLPQDAA